MSKEESLLQKWATEKFNGIDFLLTTYNSESMEEYARFYHAQQLEAISDKVLGEKFPSTTDDIDLNRLNLSAISAVKWAIGQLKKQA